MLIGPLMVSQSRPFNRLRVHRSWWEGMGRGLERLGHEAAAGGSPPGGGTCRPATLPGLEGGIRTGHGGSPSRGVHRPVALPGLKGGVRMRVEPWQRALSTPALGSEGADRKKEQMGS